MQGSFLRFSYVLLFGFDYSFSSCSYYLYEFFIFMRVLLIYQGPALQGSLVCANLSLIV